MIFLKEYITNTLFVSSSLIFTIIGDTIHNYDILENVGKKLIVEFYFTILISAFSERNYTLPFKLIPNVVAKKVVVLFLMII